MMNYQVSKIESTLKRSIWCHQKAKWQLEMINTKIVLVEINHELVEYKQVWLTICCPKTWLKVSPKTAGESEIKSLAHSERTWLTPKWEKMTIQLGVVTTKNKRQIYRQDYMHPYVAQLCWYCWQSSWKRILRCTGYPKQMYLIKIPNKVHYLRRKYHSKTVLWEKKDTRIKSLFLFREASSNMSET